MFCGRHHTLEGCISGMFNFQLSRRPQCSISSCKPLVTLCVSVRSYCGVLHARCKIACAPLSPPCAHRIHLPCGTVLMSIFHVSLALPSCHFAQRSADFAFALATPSSPCACRIVARALILVLLLHPTRLFLCVVDRSRCGTASLAQLVPVRSFLLWCSTCSLYCLMFSCAKLLKAQTVSNTNSWDPARSFACEFHNPSGDV